jgi:membrane protease YdiL (CAAX protease family)
MNRFILIVEFLLLCIAVPGYIIFFRHAPYMFAFLWGAALYGFIVYRIFYFQGWRDLWRWETVTWENMKPILWRWGFAVFGMMVFLYFYNPEGMFSLAKNKPDILLYLLFLYPVLSALPQELIFCSFFFRRYKPFFGEGKGMVFASALVFAYAHVLYINPVAPVLSFAGGIIFALTYLKHKSLSLVTIEHALYGNALFLIGLGQYFYSGGVAQ